MTRPRLFALCLLCPALWGQKKPVTLDTLRSAMPPMLGGVAPIWRPDGGAYLLRAGGMVALHQPGEAKGVEVIKTADLEAKATPPTPATRFNWQNRRVSERPVQWAPDGKHVLVLAKGDLFWVEVETKKWVQLTATPEAEADPKIAPSGKSVSFRRGHDLYSLDLGKKKVRRLTTDGAENRLNAELDWVYPEELDLGTAHWWSPDAARIAYLQFDTTSIPVYPQADLLQRPALAEPQRYPQAGTSNSSVRVGVVKASGGGTRWLNLGDTKEHLFARVYWLPGGKEVAVLRLNRVQNKVDLLAADAASGKVRTLLSESAAAWINVRNDFQFLKDGRLLFGSERSGYRHLYLQGSGEPVALTTGDWEVTELACVDEAAGQVYFMSTEESPLERHLYRAALAGGAPEKLTRDAGMHTVSFSPGCGHYTDTWSNVSTPSSTRLRTKDGRPVAVLRAADTKRYAELDLRPVELVEFQAGPGKFYGRLIKPAGFDPSKKYPGVVLVYGGPHSQQVTNSWRGVAWEQVLAHRGFVVWSMDNRGASGRGHVWEAPLHKRLGKIELEDQLRGVSWLTGQGFVDSKRIGIYGWSYGGFMTLNALLNAPDVFAAGIAGAPVTDWHFYDTIYTERYMGLPQENAAGYKDTSLVAKAPNLKGKLLLVHNFGDDNVLFQNSLTMMDALQRAGKPFELMAYPLKSHGVMGAARPHLDAAMTEFFVRTLQP